MCTVKRYVYKVVAKVFKRSVKEVVAIVFMVARSVWNVVAIVFMVKRSVMVVVATRSACIVSMCPEFCMQLCTAKRYVWKVVAKVCIVKRSVKEVVQLLCLWLRDLSGMW